MKHACELAVLSRRAFSLLGVLASCAAYGQCPGQWGPSTGAYANTTEVLAVAALPDGRLLVGGTFAIMEKSGANNIALFDPATSLWSGLGAGADARVRAMLLLPNGDAMVGGEFNLMAGVFANHLARYHAATGAWSVPGGTSGDVRALALTPDGDLIVTGDFVMAGGMFNSVDARYVARCNLATGIWSTLGVGFILGNPSLNAVAVLPGGDVVVGGFFTQAGMAAANNVARYHQATEQWSGLGSGVDGSVSALAVLANGDLIVSGAFNTAGGVPAHQLARYRSGTAEWSAIGDVQGGEVRAMTVLPGGDLVVAGNFTSAGGVAAASIARLNPATLTWTRLGAGINGNVRALASLPDGRLVAGGAMSTAGAVGFPGRIAIYTFGPPNPSIQGHPSAATTCPGGGATFSISASGTGTLSYRWRRDDVLLADEPGHIQGATTAALVLTNATRGDAGEYTCVVINACATATSHGALLSVCAADFNCVDGVNSQDFFDFLTAFFAGVPGADFNRDGAVNSQDLFDYLVEFLSGCG